MAKFGINGRIPFVTLLRKLPILTAVLVIASCGDPRTHRVVVAYPEQWSEGDNRNCFLSAAGPGGAIYPAPKRPDLPQLDCDRFVKGELIHKTPEDHVFVMDVEFSGDYLLSGETGWTCRKSQNSLKCRR